MHALLKLLAATLVVGSSLAYAQPQGELVIRSRDGKTRVGRVLSETSKGYLVSGPDGTEVVAFADIVDIRQLAPGPTSAPVAQPPVVRPVAAPVQAQAPSPAYQQAPTYQQPHAPVYQPAPTYQPEPAGPSESYQVETSADDGKSVSREGRHFGIGFGAMALTSGPVAQLQGHMDVNFGRPAYRLSLNVGLQDIYGSGFLMASVDNLFHFNVSDLYTFGGGLQLGVSDGRGSSYVYASLVLQPAIVKLGDRGQHQLSLTLAFVFGSTISYSGWSGEPRTFAGTGQAFLGYSYLF